MKFQVHYSASGLPKHEFPLDAKKIEHHFSCLSTDIHRQLHTTGISSDVHVTLKEEGSYAIVTLQGGGTESEVLSQFAKCIRSINMATPGLCFLVRTEKEGFVSE